MPLGRAEKVSASVRSPLLSPQFKKRLPNAADQEARSDEALVLDRLLVRWPVQLQESDLRRELALGESGFEHRDRMEGAVLQLHWAGLALRNGEVVIPTRAALPEDIDERMKLGCGHPNGPLTLSDFIDLDVLYAIGDSLYEEFKQTEYAPPPLHKRMVASGRIGRKAGRGFYEYARQRERAAA